MHTLTARRGFGVFILAAVLAACTDAPVGPEPQFGTGSGKVLIECPVDVSKTVTADITALGGSIELDGHRVSLPAGAVLLPTTFTLTVPASRYLEVHVLANGEHGFEFLEPVSITLSYTRCTRNNITHGPLSAYKIDPVTKTLLKHMGGVQDTFARTVTFSTPTLSGYSLAE